MGRHSVVFAVVLGAALSLPAYGYAAGRVVLDISPTRLAVAGGWTLDGRVVGAGFYHAGDAEIFGVSLTRTFPAGRGYELHAFRAAPRQTLTFDGTRGRWTARFGDTLTVRMGIAATGVQQRADAPLPCRGDFARVPVTLRGTFVLRTGTRVFATIRRAAFTGAVTFDPSGAADCTPLAPPACEPSTALAVSRADARLQLSRDAATLTFADRRADSYTWYHVMYALGSSPLAGSLPTIDVRLPGGAPIQGSGSFTAASDTRAGCTRTATGTFTGAFRARFTGWGARTLTPTPAESASYIEVGAG